MRIGSSGKLETPSQGIICDLVALNAQVAEVQEVPAENSDQHVSAPAAELSEADAALAQPQPVSVMSTTETLS